VQYICNMIRTQNQNRTLWKLIKDQNISDSNRAELAWLFSNKRTYSTAKLSIEECEQLIISLQKIDTVPTGKPAFVPQGTRQRFDPLTQKRRKLISLCYQMPPQLNFYKVNQNGTKSFWAASFDHFLCHSPKSPFPKHTLNQLDTHQLDKIITLFDKHWIPFYKNKT